ncbi:YcxB family protein [Streptomyces sp. WAC06614]|uniref:YcxB family protein n=1 Tax=Streptomyces sp. WAC06614 TaxID=2487416 RepID=UPI000F78C9B7|nr:YcxB family protein [Streptomyces sp. WAC06614]RSS82812.1 YcxB family protein [Streptomyces sp. WAC06614]
MDDIRRTTVRFRGTLTREEFDEALRVWGLLRHLRRILLALAVLNAALGVVTADGGSPDLTRLSLALACAALGLLGPPFLAGRMFRADRDRGEKQCVVDGSGITVSRGDEQILRVSWPQVKRVHETARLYVVTGRVGWKNCMVVLPKRLLAGAGGIELTGLLLDTHVGRRH